MLIVWALCLAVVGHVVLTNTRFGNWIFASGGDANAARTVGVPVGRVKIPSSSSARSAPLSSRACAGLRVRLGRCDARPAQGVRGDHCRRHRRRLLTGGYGSVVGALFGALIFGVVSQGFFYTGVDGDWFRVFLGCVLLAAVMFNTTIRKRFTGGG